MFVSSIVHEVNVGWQDQHSNYVMTDNLETRIAFHTFPSSSTQTIWEWAREIYYGVMSDDGNSLEVGCGTGVFWEKKFLDACLKKGTLTLTDYSPAMIEKCQSIPLFQNREDINFEEQNVAKLTYDDQSFSLILSHFMMYHVEPVEDGISELARVLTDDGVAVFVTTDDTEAFKEIYQLLENTDPLFATARSTRADGPFCKSNARKHLEKKFSIVEELDWKNTMFLTDRHPTKENVTGRDALVAWVRSLQNIKDLNVNDEIWQHFAKEVQKRINESGIAGMPITTNRVAYVCKLPIRD